MNYGQVIKNIRDLGFADDSEIEEFETDVNIISNSINRAITEISLDYAPIVDRYIVPNPPTYIDDNNNEKLPELVEINMYDASDNTFMRLTDVPVKKMLQDGIYTRFNDYEIENGDTLIIASDDICTETIVDGEKQYISNNLIIFYVKDHEPVTEDVIDPSSEEYETEVPLPRKAHHLLPLLASYYIWLDDDPAKAQEYLNRYQMALQSAKAESEKPRARIRTDWGGRVWL